MRLISTWRTGWGVLISRLIPVALLALLLALTIGGSVWHTHASGGEANCSSCHLSHQAIAGLAAPAQLLALEQLGENWVAEEPAAPSRLSGRRAASRAPPSL
jgi:hypothetical protein